MVSPRPFSPIPAPLRPLWLIGCKRFGLFGCSFYRFSLSFSVVQFRFNLVQPLCFLRFNFLTVYKLTIFFGVFVLFGCFFATN